MTTSFLDVLMLWLGDGPSAPKYCQMVASHATRALQFGQQLADGPADHLELTLGAIGAQVAAPTNALAWHVPDLATTALTSEEQARLRAAWPPLRRLSGAPFTIEQARGDPLREAVLLEVFPAAFRRLEYLFSSLEVPTSQADWDIPRAATPRWFWIWGFGATGLRDRFQAIASKQWEPRPAPSIDGFLRGLAPIYIDARETLGSFEDGDRIHVRAFDSTGLPIDPDFVFATFGRLADDSDFARLKLEHPEGLATAYQAADRHVIVFTDQSGAPYTARPAPAEPPPPTDPEAGDLPAERVLLQLAPGLGAYPFPEHGVLVLPADTGLGGQSGPISLALTGTHVRLGPHPNGDLGATITVDFAPRLFLRLQVLDYHDWFARNPNPRNRLARYSEGNLVTPLIDGAPFFRELYRMLRATYKDVDPRAPSAAFDPDAPAGDAPAEQAARARVYLSNAWVEPHTPLLGRRGLLAAPKTQDVAPADLPAYDQLKAQLRLVAAQGIPGLVDLPSATADQLQWWLVSEAGALPPGASVELRQLLFADDYHGDDPRLPGVSLNADIFGIVAPFPGAAGSSRAFVGTAGRFALPVVYARGRAPLATLRITIWPPGAAEPAAHTYGQVLLPEPADPFSRPAYAAPLDAGRLRLEYAGVPGSASLVLEPGALAADQALALLNARSGEAQVADYAANPGQAIRVELRDLALQDILLVGALPPGQRNPADCTHLFALTLGRPLLDLGGAVVDAQHADPGAASAAALQAGAAPAHPTELAGILREAISAGVDVRLLGWRDPTQPARAALLSTLGTVSAINASYFGRRGQAIWDATSRETFHVHHQKGAFLRTASQNVVAFLGGIDLLSGRWDTHAHRQPDPERPSATWHDVQCKIEGHAAWDVYRNFMQRWNAAAALPDVVGADPGRTPLPPPDDPAWGPTPVVDDPQVTMADGPHAVQINRTLAPHLDAYGGGAPPHDIVDASTGDLSVRESWRGLLEVAEQYLYIEEQYFWIEEHAAALNAWLRAKAERFVFLLLPRRFADIAVADQVHYALRRRALNLLLYGVAQVPAGTDVATLPHNVAERVAVFHLASRENLDPIYVHSKLVIADDTWFTIGSANLTRRSWTFDSEINAACIDTRLRRGGHVSARQLRVDLLAEHLQLQPAETPLIEDARDAFRLVRAVLAGQRPWMRTHLLALDLAFTHYGPFPADFDPIMLDAINLLADTDGTAARLEPRLIDAAGLFQALRDASGGLAFGGLGRLRFSFDVSGLGLAPADLVVRVVIGQADAPAAQQITLGPWPAASPAEAGLLAIGQTYRVRASALAAGSLAPVADAPEQLVLASEFLTTVLVVF